MTKPGKWLFLAGDSEFGPIVHDGQRAIYWRYPSSRVFGNILRARAPFTPEAMVGFSGRVKSGSTVIRGAGLIICNGRNVAYLLRYSDRSFKSVEPAPFPISGITGDTFYGVIAYSGRNVAYLRHFDGHWAILPDAPFDISGITGQNRGGVVVYSGSRVAYLGKYREGKWRRLSDAPFSIVGMTGGIAPDGERLRLTICNGTKIARLAMNPSASQDGGDWSLQADAPFPVRALAGAAENDILALSITNDAIACRTDNRWEVIARDTAILQYSNKRIWSNKKTEGQYQAFTDLEHFRGMWYCCFRQGSTHLSKDGVIYILRSKDGENWQLAHRLADERYDFRDPHMFIIPGKDGRKPSLWLTSYRNTTRGAPRTVTCSTQDGETWSATSPIGPERLWLWRTTWNQYQDIGLAVGYVPGQTSVSLYSTLDGLRYTLVQEELYTTPRGAGLPSEHGMAYHPDGTAHCLLRRDAPDGKDDDAVFGISAPPYREWSWSRIGVKIGGPELLRLADGRIVASCRRYVDPDKWAPAYLQFATTHHPSRKPTPDYSPMDRLHSDNAADIGYAGMVEKDGHVWFSYYYGVVPNVHVYIARVVWPDIPPQ